MIIMKYLPAISSYEHVAWYLRLAIFPNPVISRGAAGADPEAPKVETVEISGAIQSG